MKKSRVGVGIAGAMLLTMAGPALAAEVTRSITIPAASEVIWSKMGDFCSIEKWHPVIARCEASEQGGATIRKLTTKDGGVLVERLTAVDRGKRTYSYEILESPLPVEGYRSTIKVDTLGSSLSKVTWSSSFTPKGATAEEATAVIDKIYEVGLHQIQEITEMVD